MAGVEGGLEVEEGEGDEKDGADVPGDSPLGPPDVAGPEMDSVAHQAGQQRDIWQNDQSSGYCNVYHLAFIVISADCHSTVQYSTVQYSDVIVCYVSVKMTIY